MIADAQTAIVVHALFEWLGLAAGAAYYRRCRRRSDPSPLLGGQHFAVLVGCLAGAGFGNKAVFWIDVPDRWPEGAGASAFFTGGQSMVGGLLGGLIGVELAKKLTGQRQSTGDQFVGPILLGLMVGRIGCFLAGLHDDTYGLPTGLPWGVDFGDGIARHPTQLFEIAFAALLWLALSQQSLRLAAEPGMSFKLMLVAYLVWRMLIDTLKPVPFAYPFGWSGIQWVCAIALGLYGPLTYRQWCRFR